MVLAADMVGSPRLQDSRPSFTPLAAASWSPPQSLEQATQFYVNSLEPADWGKRRAGAAFLLAHLNPPRLHRAEWENLGRILHQAPAPASAWECARQLAGNELPGRGLLGPYQNRLQGLRTVQIEQALQPLKSILQANDYLAFVQRVPARRAEPAGALELTLRLHPLTQPGREDLLAYPLWWGILANQSNHQALRAGLELARGRLPDLPYRREGTEVVCWTPGPDGRDEQGLVEASLQDGSDEPVAGDWIYRFR